jgi:hypothetical protein
VRRIQLHHQGCRHSDRDHRLPGRNGRHPRSRSSRRGDYHYRQFQLRRTTHGVAGATVSVTNNASAAHSATSQTAGQFDVHLAGSGEATFTAPNQPGEYAFYCTYHPSMKGTLIVQ